MSELSITVQVYEDPEHLRRVLTSLADSRLLRHCPIMVINNSNDLRMRQHVNAEANFRRLPQITCFDQDLWKPLRQVLCARLSSGAEQWLRQIDLDALGWSAHLGRMIGMIVTRALQSDAKRTLHLDADMIVPKDLSLELNTLPEFTSFPVSGCPDLSRLEWIELAALHAGAPNSASDPRYAQKMRHTVDSTTLDLIFSHFTELSRGQVAAPSPPNITLPPREEFHGGTYILATTRFSTAPYGEWYDNDWTFFEMVRLPHETRDMLTASFVHGSRQKTILNEPVFELEEVGKVLHRASLKSDSTRAAIQDGIELRYSEISMVRAALQQARAGLLDKFGEENADRLFLIIDNMQSRILKIEKSYLTGALARFRQSQRHWHEVLSAADQGL